MFGRRIIPAFPRMRYLINPSLLSSRKLFTTSFNLHTKGSGLYTTPHTPEFMTHIDESYRSLIFDPDKDCSHNDEVKPKIETTHYQLVFTCTAKLGENHETTCNHRSTHQDWLNCFIINVFISVFICSHTV